MVEFISETLRDRGNLSTFYHSTQPNQFKEKKTASKWEEN
jgi:hypothetical protein